MRFLPSLGVLLLTLACAASSAHAEDPPEQPLVKVPGYGLEALAPSFDERPTGWSAVSETGGVPANAPTVQAMLAIAKVAGIQEHKVAVRAIPLEKGAGPKRDAALMTLVAVDEKSGAFTRALAAAVVDHGWMVREMGSPMRVLVIRATSGEAAAELRDWLVDLVVRRTTEQAVKRILEAGRKGSRETWNEGVKLLSRAGRIEPRSGFVLAVRARMVPRGRPEQALAFYRAAIHPDAPVPAPDDWKSPAAARLGQILLERAQDDERAEALAALLLAVKLEQHISDPLDRFGAHYNLACVYARLDQKDKALEHLDSALAHGKTLLGADYAFHYGHAKDKDPDMAPLREDERFAQILAKHAPDVKQPPPKKDG